MVDAGASIRHKKTISRAHVQFLGAPNPQQLEVPSGCWSRLTFNLNLLRHSFRAWPRAGVRELAACGDGAADSFQPVPEHGQLVFVPTPAVGTCKVDWHPGGCCRCVPARYRSPGRPRRTTTRSAAPSKLCRHVSPCSDSSE